MIVYIQTREEWENIITIRGADNLAIYVSSDVEWFQTQYVRFIFLK